LISLLLHNHIVVSSGELVTHCAVYSAVEQNRLAKAKLSDKTVLFVPKKKWLLAIVLLLLLKLGIINLKNARDLSWASAAFILDGAKINLQVEKKHWPYQLIRLKAPVMIGTFNRIYQGIH
jgi:hypothetical protein